MNNIKLTKIMKSFMSIFHLGYLLIISRKWFTINQHITLFKREIWDLNNIETEILFIAYTTWFSILFLTNSLYLGNAVFVYLVIPIAIMPIKNINITKKNKSNNFIRVISFSNVNEMIKISKSKIFILSFIYILSIVFSSWLTPTMTGGWLLTMLSFAIPICAFLLITANLIINYPNFIDKFFYIACLIVSLNAIINIVDHLQSIEDWGRFFDFRLFANYGIAPDDYPTTAALSYEIYFLCALHLAISTKKKFKKITCFIFSIILLIACFLTQSRGALGAGFISLTVIAIFSSSHIRNLFGILLCSLLSIFLLMPKVGTFAITRLDNHRFDVWKRFISLYLERPVLGYGERITFTLPIPYETAVGHAHNLYLGALIRGGIPAFLSLAGTLFFCCQAALKYFKNELNPIPFLFISTIIISGIVDYELLVFMPNWQWPTFWMGIALCLGVDLSNDKINVEHKGY